MTSDEQRDPGTTATPPSAYAGPYSYAPPTGSPYGTPAYGTQNYAGQPYGTTPYGSAPVTGPTPGGPAGTTATGHEFHRTVIDPASGQQSGGRGQAAHTCPDDQDGVPRPGGGPFCGAAHAWGS